MHECSRTHTHTHEYRTDNELRLLEIHFETAFISNRPMTTGKMFIAICDSAHNCVSYLIYNIYAYKQISVGRHWIVSNVVCLVACLVIIVGPRRKEEKRAKWNCKAFMNVHVVQCESEWAYVPDSIQFKRNLPCSPGRTAHTLLPFVGIGANKSRKYVSIAFN